MRAATMGKLSLREGRAGPFLPGEGPSEGCRAAPTASHGQWSCYTGFAKRHRWNTAEANGNCRFSNR